MFQLIGACKHHPAESHKNVPLLYLTGLRLEWQHVISVLSWVAWELLHRKIQVVLMSLKYLLDQWKPPSLHGKNPFDWNSCNMAVALKKPKTAPSPLKTNFCSEFLQQFYEEKQNLWVYNVVELKAAAISTQKIIYQRPQGKASS